jgi:phosphoglycolate phosphatase-like HAD superfamily hydrolase
MSQQGVLCFDLDGPILDVSEKYYRVYADLVCEQGGLPIDKDSYWSSKRDRKEEAETLGVSNPVWDVETYRHARRERIETIEYLKYDRLWPGILPLLNKAASSNSIILVTLRHCSASLHDQLRRLGLHSVFTHVLSASDEDTPIDRSEIKARLVESVCITDAPIGWFIGDTETDIKAGKRLGLRTAAVTYGIRTSPQLAAAGPDVLIDSPEELVEWVESYLRLRRE